MSVQGSDVTGLANPIERLGKPCVNVLAVASALGLQTRIDGRVLWITDAMGVRWHGVDGDWSLISPGRTLALPVPIYIFGGDAFLPVETLASLAGLDCTIDTSRQTAAIELSRTRDAYTRDEERALHVPSGWKALIVPKTPDELAAPSGFVEIVPPARNAEPEHAASTSVVPVPQPAAPASAKQAPVAQAVAPVPPTDWLNSPAMPFSSTTPPATATPPVAQSAQVAPVAPAIASGATVAHPAPSSPAVASGGSSTPANPPSVTQSPATLVPSLLPPSTQTTFVPAPPPPVQPPLVTKDAAPVPDGWTDVVVPKTAAELNSTANAVTSGGTINVSNQKSILPPATDHMRVNMSTGYVPGYDGGMSITGTGKVLGDEVDFQGVGTYGSERLQFQPVGFEVNDTEHGRKINLGVLESDVFGGSTGARYSLEKAPNSWTSLSLYQPLAGPYHHGDLIGYRDDWRLTNWLNLDGEVTSDGSAMSREKVRLGALSLYGTYGKIKETSETDYSAGASYSVRRLLTLGASDSHTGYGLNRENYSTYYVQIPITTKISVNATNATTLTPGSSSRTTTVGLTVPVLKLTATGQYQWTNMQFNPLGTNSFYDRYRTASLNLGGSVNKNVSIQYWANAQTQQDGQYLLRQQIQAKLLLDKSNSLNISDGFTQFQSGDQLDVQWIHNFSKDESLSLEYGPLLTYQSETVKQNARGFRLIWSQALDFATPAAGGAVTGRVRNMIGRPMKGVRIILGPYSGFTAADGGYEFRNVPHGSYELYVDDSSLPANFKNCCAKQVIGVESRKTVNRDFEIIPLGSVTGYVYNDKKGTGKYEDGEGVANVLVRLGQFTTLTGNDGFFGFYNADPGKYLLEVDPNHSLQGLTPETAVRPVDLRADQAVRDVNVKLVFHDKPVELQELK
ncbi:MAG: hypothetical protein P4L33_11165 [Capsulimonadaceae bacterium]|nr:hypothetical protein [Capsulimonadaceae bacterium]